MQQSGLDCEKDVTRVVGEDNSTDVEKLGKEHLGNVTYGYIWGGQSLSRADSTSYDNRWRLLGWTETCEISSFYMKVLVAVMVHSNRDKC